MLVNRPVEFVTILFLFLGTMLLPAQTNNLLSDDGRGSPDGCLDDFTERLRLVTLEQQTHTQQNGIIVFLEVCDGHLRATGWISVRPPEPMLRIAMDFAVFEVWKNVKMDAECSGLANSDQTVVAPLHITHPNIMGDFGVTIFREDEAARTLLLKYLNNPAFYVMPMSDFTGLFLYYYREGRAWRNGG